VIELVKEIDRSDEFLTAYQQAQPILPDSPLALLSTDFLRSRLREIAEVALTRKSISQRRSFPVRKWSHFIGTKLRNRTIYTGQRIQEFFTGQSSRIAWKSRLTNEGIKP
jgi:hypothetical protein